MSAWMNRPVIIEGTGKMGTAPVFLSIYRLLTLGIVI